MPQPATDTPRFYAHASSEGSGRGHLVKDAVYFEDAAIRFVEDRLDGRGRGRGAGHRP